jgi:hypothetical protein
MVVDGEKDSFLFPGKPQKPRIALATCLLAGVPFGTQA